MKKPIVTAAAEAAHCGDSVALAGEGVDLKEEAGRVEAALEHDAPAAVVRPQCGREGARYDHARASHPGAAGRAPAGGRPASAWPTPLRNRSDSGMTVPPEPMRILRLKSIPAA